MRPHSVLAASEEFPRDCLVEVPWFGVVPGLQQPLPQFFHPQKEFDNHPPPRRFLMWNIGCMFAQHF